MLCPGIKILFEGIIPTSLKTSLQVLVSNKMSKKSQPKNLFFNSGFEFSRTATSKGVSRSSVLCDSSLKHKNNRIHWTLCSDDIDANGLRPDPDLEPRIGGSASNLWEKKSTHESALCYIWTARLLALLSKQMWKKGLALSGAFLLPGDDGVRDEPSGRQQGVATQGKRSDMNEMF